MVRIVYTNYADYMINVARQMTYSDGRRQSGFTYRLRAMAPQIITIHCAFHSESLGGHASGRSSGKPHKGKAQMQPNPPTFVC